MKRPLAGVGMRVLSQDGVDNIHLATLEVLGQAGVFVESDDALDVLAAWMGVPIGSPFSC